MNRMKQINLHTCLYSKAESWAKVRLEETGLKFTRQAQWGYRLFDFWNHHKGIAVEIDGVEHNRKIDIFKDKVDYEVSGIIVFRVNNFNEEEMNNAIEGIGKSVCWNDRRKYLGLKPIK